jgi:cobalt/nickel transport protein
MTQQPAGDLTTTEPTVTGQPAPAASAPPGQPAPAPPRSFLRRWRWVIAGLAIVAVIVVVLAPLASPDPDGLEAVAKQQGWLGAAQDAIHGVFPGYSIPGLDGASGTIVSGLIGVGIVFVAIVALGWLLRRRTASRG